MKIYVDLVLFLNFAFDFLLLIVVSILLKRNVPLFKIMIGAFLGSLTTLTLFFSISSFTLFVIKLGISFLMILVSFGFRNVRYFIKNISFLYMASIVLGGFLYFLNIEFSYKQEGLVFYHNGLSINFILLLISSPVILYFYIKQMKALKENYSFYYKVTFYFENKTVLCNAYLDTGNKLKDPYSNSPIVLLYQKKIPNHKIPFHYVSYDAVGHTGLLKCIRVPKMEIEGIGMKENVLVGIMREEIKMDGVDCILNIKLLEANHV